MALLQKADSRTPATACSNIRNAPATVRPPLGHLKKGGFALKEFRRLPCPFPVSLRLLENGLLEFFCSLLEGSTSRKESKLGVYEGWHAL